MKKFLTIIALSLFLFTLTACDKLPLLFPKGMIAHDERNLILIAVALMLIVVLPVIFMTLIFAWRYRDHPKRTAKYTPNWEHSVLLEVIWWAVPLIIIIILAIITWRSSHQLDPYRELNIKNNPNKPITVQAIALDWKWLFIYPAQNIAVVNSLEIPVDVPINIYVTADAPMNSLWIPALAGQIYAMTGMQTQLHIIGNQIGVYHGLSSNYSGHGFSDMKFSVKVTTAEDFTRFIKDAKHFKHQLGTKEYNALAKPSENNKIEFFYPVEADLYRNVIMKFMMPMDQMQ